MVIPASIRKALDLHPGDKLTVRVEEGRLLLEKRERILGRLKARFATLPPGVSLADELIAERRAEARAEEKAWQAKQL